MRWGSISLATLSPPPATAECMRRWGLSAETGCDTRRLQLLRALCASPCAFFAFRLVAKLSTQSQQAEQRRCVPAPRRRASCSEAKAAPSETRLGSQSRFMRLWAPHWVPTSVPVGLCDATGFEVPLLVRNVVLLQADVVLPGRDERRPLQAQVLPVHVRRPLCEAPGPSAWSPGRGRGHPSARSSGRCSSPRSSPVLASTPSCVAAAA